MAGNDLGSSSISLTDGGAIEGSLSLSRDVVQGAAELTLAILDRQNDLARASFDAYRANQADANQFAIAGGRPELAVMQDAGKILLVIGGIIAAGMAIKAARS